MESKLMPIEKTILENAFKDQARIGYLMQQLADTISAFSLEVQEKGYTGDASLFDQHATAYLTLKLTGEMLYQNASKVSDLFNLKNSEDSMWGN